jgi:hypothetical protein
VLILTDNRLICVKIEKGGRVLAIRGVWVIPKVTTGKEKSSYVKSKPDKEKEKKKGKDSVNQAIISIDPKGENEFVVLTVRRAHLRASRNLPRIFQATKSLSFVAGDSALRSKWVSKVRRALEPATTSSAAA